jgi:hypothetical protein
VNEADKVCFKILFFWVSLRNQRKRRIKNELFLTENKAALKIDLTIISRDYTLRFLSLQTPPG